MPVRARRRRDRERHPARGLRRRDRPATRGARGEEEAARARPGDQARQGEHRLGGAHVRVGRPRARHLASRAVSARGRAERHRGGPGDEPRHRARPAGPLRHDRAAARVPRGAAPHVLPPEHYALVFFPTLADLSSLVLASVRLVIPGSRCLPRRTATAGRRHLGSRLSAEKKEALEDAGRAPRCPRRQARPARVDRHVELTAARAGLMLTGDLRVPMRMMKDEVRAIGELSEETKRGDLLAFCAADAYGTFTRTHGRRDPQLVGQQEQRVPRRPRPESELRLPAGGSRSTSTNASRRAPSADRRRVDGRRDEAASARVRGIRGARRAGVVVGQGRGLEGRDLAAVDPLPSGCRRGRVRRRARHRAAQPAAVSGNRSGCFRGARRWHRCSWQAGRCPTDTGAARRGPTPPSTTRPRSAAACPGSGRRSPPARRSRSSWEACRRRADRSRRRPGRC